MLKQIVGILTLGLVGAQAIAASKGNVLVILSSEDKITLKTGMVHPTGFFLPELMGPVKALLEAGYTPVFANPLGTKAVMDKVSDLSSWFSSQTEHRRIRELCEQLELCAPGKLTGTLNLQKLSEIRKQGLENYVGVFLPGGHAPMEDLWKDADLGAILRDFHSAGKPTALVCHAPIALLAAMEEPQRYITAKLADDRGTMVDASKNWIYKGYAVAVFTTREEQQEEPGGHDNALGGYVRFYADEVLEKAGAFVKRAKKWSSQVVVDRELITGQNPFSHDALAKALVKALDAAH